MTKSEALKRMKKIYNGGTHDPEEAHCTGDRLLCELLTELGFGKVVEVYKKIEKWYA